MSDKVDVLSVMDSAIERERNEGRAYVAQVAARATVAELIEAATLARNALDATGATGGAFLAVDAALARCKGGLA